jgi:hypothetical protein
VCLQAIPAADRDDCTARGNFTAGDWSCACCWTVPIRRDAEKGGMEQTCSTKRVFGYGLLKFNTHRINVHSNAWSTKCILIACMSAQIRSNLRDESIKPN